MNEFLNSLSDRELAFSVHFKLDSYLIQTQETILNHMKSRCLNITDIENLHNSKSTFVYEFQLIYFCFSHSKTKAFTP
jgi:hypothetical protein